MFLSQTNGPLLYLYDNVSDTIKHIKESGFSRVDISFFSCFKRDPIYFSDDYMKVVEEYKEALKRYDVIPAQSHEPMGNSIGDDNGEYYMKKTPRSIEMAAKIGCPSITIHSGCANKYAMGKDEFVEKNVAAIKKLIPYAEEYGIEILLENTGYRNLSPFNGVYASTAQDLIDIVDEIDHPLLAVNWDVGHANFNGLDQYEEIKTLGSRLHGLHVHDNLGFRRVEDNDKTIEGDMHTLPLYWSVDFDKLLKALAEVGYKGTFNFEVDAPRGIVTYSNDCPELKKDALQARLDADKLLYSLGRLILKKYNCFEG